MFGVIIYCKRTTADTGYSVIVQHVRFYRLTTAICLHFSARITQ